MRECIILYAFMDICMYVYVCMHPSMHACMYVCIYAYIVFLNES